MHERAGAHRRRAAERGRWLFIGRRVRGGVSRRVRDAKELDMSAPLPLSLPAGSASALALAFGVGIGFGWFLERAGLGSARS